MATLNVTNLQNVASTVTNVSLLADGTTSLVLNSTGTSRTGGIRYVGGVLETYDGSAWVPAGTGTFVPLAGGTMTGPLIPAATGQSGYWTRTGTTLAPATATDSIQVADGAAATPSVNFAGSPTTGFFAPSAGAVGVSNAGTQSIEVDATGNVLIGGTLPGTPNIELRADGKTSVFSAFQAGVMKTSRALGTAQTLLEGWGAATSLADGTQVFQFMTDGTLRIGGTLPSSPNITLDAAGLVYTTNSGTNNAGYFITTGGLQAASYAVADGYMLRQFDTTLKLIGRVGTTGGVQLTNGSSAWAAYVSESRLKDIVGDCDYDQAWDLVRDIELKRYFYKEQDEEFKKGVPYLGPMADWLEQQDPELVIYNQPDEDGPVRTFNQGLLDMKALAALSAALKRIEALEAEVAALKNN